LVEEPPIGALQIYNPLLKKQGQGVKAKMKFKPGQMLLGAKNEIILDRNQVFHRIFEGKPINK